MAMPAPHLMGAGAQLSGVSYLLRTGIALCSLTIN